MGRPRPLGRWRKQPRAGGSGPHAGRGRRPPFVAQHHSHPGLRHVSRIKGRTHVSTRPRAAPIPKILLAPERASTHVAKFFGARFVRKLRSAEPTSTQPEVGVWRPNDPDPQSKVMRRRILAWLAHR